MSTSDIKSEIDELPAKDRAEIFNYLQEIYCLDCGKVLYECICLDE